METGVLQEGHRRPLGFRETTTPQMNLRRNLSGFPGLDARHPVRPNHGGVPNPFWKNQAVSGKEVYFVPGFLHCKGNAPLDTEQNFIIRMVMHRKLASGFFFPAMAVQVMGRKIRHDFGLRQTVRMRPAENLDIPGEIFE